ncbi:unnamed protein product [Choristocarpus tenellus]
MTVVLSALGLPSTHAEPLKVKTALAWLPINILFCAMLLTSFMALKWNTVPMFQVFKTLSMVCITIMERFLWGRQVSSYCWGALALIVTGAAGATLVNARDVGINNGWGLFWMISNVLCTVSYVLYLRFATTYIRLSRLGMVKYNNFLGAILLVPMVLGKGEIQTLLDSDMLNSWKYASLNVFVGIVGFAINLAALWCIETTSATTYSITGNLSKIPSAILAVFLFGTSISQKSGICIAISLTGGLLYTVASNRQKTLAQENDYKDMEEGKLHEKVAEVMIPLKEVQSSDDEEDTDAPSS